MASSSSPRSPRPQSPHSPRSPRTRNTECKAADTPTQHEKRYIEVPVEWGKLTALRESLREGGGLTAAQDVGQFREGMVLLAGLNLNLEEHGVLGLKDGDDIDWSLRGVVQEALAALADDANDVVFLSRPPWIKQKKGQAKCFIFPASCCQRRKWRRNTKLVDRLRWLVMGLEKLYCRLVYPTQPKYTLKKEYDFFICGEMSQSSSAMWLQSFCENRGWKVYYEPPCKAVQSFKAGLAVDAEEEKLHEEFAKAEHQTKAITMDVADEGIKVKKKSRRKGGSKSGSKFHSSSDDNPSCTKTGPHRNESKGGLSADESCASSNPMRSGLNSKATVACTSSNELCSSGGPKGKNSPTSNTASGHISSVENSPSGTGGRADLKAKVCNVGVIEPTAMSQPLAKPDPVPADEKEDELPCKRWMERRETMIQKSAVVLCLIGNANLENLTTMLDCMWAWRHGVLILPIRHGETNDRKLVKTLRNRFPWLFRSGLGIPVCGRGANRQKLAIVFARSLMRARRNYGKIQLNRNDRLPRAFNDAAGWAFERIVKDFKDRGLLHEPPPKVDDDDMDQGRDPLAGRSSSVGIEEENQQCTPTLSGAQRASVDGKRNFVGGRMSLRRSSLGGRNSDALMPEKKRESLNIGGVQVVLEVAEEILEEKHLEEYDLEPLLEERVYGVISYLAFFGTTHRAQCSAGLDALCSIACSTQGARSMADYGSPEVLRFIFANLAANYKTVQDAVQTCRSEDKKYSASRLVSWISPRLSSTRGSRSVSPTSPGSSDAASPRSKFSWVMTRFTFNAPTELSDDSPRVSSPGSARSRTRNRRGDIRGSSPASPALKRNAGLSRLGDSSEIDVIRSCVNTLRKLACRSKERKESLVKLKCVSAVAIVLTSDVFEVPEAACLRQSAAAFIRNLSAGGSHEAVRGLIDEGALQIIKDQGSCENTAPEIRCHLLATLQNIVSLRTDAGKPLFNLDPSQEWVDLCTKSLKFAVAAKQSRLVQQSLDAIANMALFRLAATEDMDIDCRSETNKESWNPQLYAIASGENAAQKKYHDDEEASSKTNPKAAEATEMEDDETSNSDSDSNSGWGKSAHETGSEWGKSSTSSPTQRWGASSTSASSSGCRSSSHAESEHASDICQNSVMTNPAVFERSCALAAEKVGNDVLRELFKLMKDVLQFPSSKKRNATIASSVTALCNFAQDTHLERLIGHMGGVELVLESVSRSRSRNVHLQACRFFWNMSYSWTNQKKIVDAGVLSHIMLLLSVRQSKSDVEIHLQGCGLIRNLATGPPHQKRVVYQRDIVVVLCRSMALYLHDRSVCMQAAAALRLLAQSAPPVAEAAVAVKAVEVLLAALARAQTDWELVNQVLHALECVLLSQNALEPFCLRGGPEKVLHYFKLSDNPYTLSRACRVLATALSHAMETDNGTDGMDLVPSNSVVPSKSVNENQRRSDLDQEDGNKNILREELRNMRLIPILCKILEANILDTISCESVAIVLLNMAVEGGANSADSVQFKHDLGKLSTFFIEIVDGRIKNQALQAHSERFVSFMLHLLASVSLDIACAVKLYRTGATSRVLAWMEMYAAAARVQTHGCDFFRNFAASQLRVCESVYRTKAVDYISSLLEKFLGQPSVLIAAMGALESMARTTRGASFVAESYVAERTFSLLHEYSQDHEIQKRGFTLVWNLTADPYVAAWVVELGGVTEVGTAFTKFKRDVDVIVPVIGVLRNLLVETVCARTCATQWRDAYGFRCLLKLMWKNCLPDRTSKEAKKREYDDLRVPPEIFETERGTRIAEQIVSVLANLTHIAQDDSKNYADCLLQEFDSKHDFINLRDVLEIHVTSAMLQYQGMSLTAQIIGRNKMAKQIFSGFGDHISKMIRQHRGSPVADAADLLLEEVV